MNMLRKSTSAKAVSCVGEAYELRAHNWIGVIALIIDNQELTLVGTPPANFIAASWHGAREEEK
jgi:hypothetical protein